MNDDSAEALGATEADADGEEEGARFAASREQEEGDDTNDDQDDEADDGGGGSLHVRHCAD